MQIECSEKELFILKKISHAAAEAGFPCYLIGGFVRDKIIGRKTSAEVVTNVLTLLLNPAILHHQEVYFHFNLVTADPDDNKFTDAYVAGQAD
ncbi:MAG: hypothetical protein EOO01_14175, partial [Chitinophagaceae bacterium]